jgi:MFS family permease
MNAGAPAGVNESSVAYRWYILFLLLAVNALSYADRHVFSILIPAIKAEFGVSDSVLGLIGGPVFVVSFVIFSMPLARLADTWSARGVLAICAAFWSAATAGCGAALNVAQLAIARALVGVGEAGGLPPSQSMLSRIFPDSIRARAMGIFASATHLGVMLGLVGGAIIAANWGWRAAFFTLAAAGIPLALLIWFTAPRQQGAVAGVAVSAGSMLQAAAKCWSIPSFRLLIIGIGVFNIFGFGAAIWLPTYYIRSHGMSVVEAGAWLGFGASLGGVIGALVSGVVVDALRPRDLRWQLRIPALGYLVGFPLLALKFLIPGGLALSLGALNIPVVALVGLATGFLSAFWAGPAFDAVARLTPPELRAQAMALLVIVINVIGSGFGPVITGMVSDALTAAHQAEALRYSLLSLSGLGLVAGGLIWWGSELFPKDVARREAAAAAGA